MTKSLSKAIALATALGAAASAHAINVNQDGLGEVLLYSLYTAEQGNVTNVHITNTTNFAKAVKVRFVEGQNSREVLDFNLYLSPNDQWSGAVTQTATGAKLITADKSCTAPAIPATGAEFREFAFKSDGGNQTLARTRVGHIEVIEMGVLDAANSALVTADHNKAGSAPAGCASLVKKFTTVGNDWSESVQKYNTGFLPAAQAKGKTGGLYGYASILNIEGSTQTAYDAVAIDNFLTDVTVGPAPGHTATGSTFPNLNSGGNKFATFKNGEELEFVNPASAISALLMKESISNDFVLDKGRSSQTNWVITFPTKRFHVDTGAVGAEAPFINRWAAGKSCHSIDISKWDNEEYAPVTKPEDEEIDFSPMPPKVVGEILVPALCNETNILTFNGGKVLGGQFVSYNYNLAQPEYQFGWMNIAFNGHHDRLSQPQKPYQLKGVNTDTSVVETINGLPVIGFSAVTISNGVAKNGVMNNYGSSTSHKAQTTKDH